MTPDNINFSAYKYAESSCRNLISICYPLFQFGIKVFAYFRFFNDGRYLYLCNNLDWLQYCLEHVQSNEGTSLGNEIGHVPEDNYHCFLWPTQKTDYLMSALYEYNIWNGLSIFKQSDDSIELWGFAGDRHSENLQNFYIENIELLKDFTATFNLNATEIIVPTHHNLALYKDFKSMQHTNDEYLSRKIEAFLKATPIIKYPLMTQAGEVILSNKELHCAGLLAAGKTAKQIARELDTGIRTVEKHLENVKHKIGCNDKESIIKVYKESVINWL